MEKRLAVEIQTRTKQEERKGKVAVAAGRAAGVFRRRVDSTGKYDGPLVGVSVGQKWESGGLRQRKRPGRWRLLVPAQCAERGSICLTWWFVEPGEVRSVRVCRCDPLFFSSLSSSTGGIKSFPSRCLHKHSPAVKTTTRYFKMNENIIVESALRFYRAPPGHLLWHLVVPTFALRHRRSRRDATKWLAPLM